MKVEIIDQTHLALLPIGPRITLTSGEYSNEGKFFILLENLELCR